MPTTFTTSDVNTILGQFGDIGHFLGRYLPLADTISGLSNLLGSATAPLKGFDAAAASISVGADDSSISFTLPDHSVVRFVVSNDIVQKINAGDNSYLLAIDYAPRADTFTSLFAKTPFASLVPDSSEIVVSTQGVTSLGGVDLPSGISVVESFDLAGSSNPVLRYLHHSAGVDTVSVIASAGKEYASLSGDIALNETLSVGNFHLTAKDINFAIETIAGVPSFTAAQVLTLSGYDPTQNAPTLTVTTGFKFDASSLSLYGQVDAAGWTNPFGISGTSIRSLGLQAGLTYTYSGIDNLGFVVDMTHKVGGQTFDYTLALSFDTNTPSQDAFQLTVNQPVNLVELGLMTYTSVLGSAGSTLMSKLEPLFKYIDITLVSNTVDGKLAPLLKAVPFDTVIAATPLTAGYGINAKVDVLGEVGTLSLNANGDLTVINGSLEVPALKWGTHLSLSGVEQGSMLSASFALDAASHSVSMAGSGKLVVEGFTIARADFDITSSQVSIHDTFLDFGVARFDIDHLDVDLASGAGSGLANITVAKLPLAGIKFTANDQQLSFDADLKFADALSINAHLQWSDITHRLDGTGTAKIGGHTIANSSIEVLPSGSVSIQGRLGVEVASFGHVNTSLTATYDSNDQSVRLNVQADVSGLGHINLTIGANDNIANAIYDQIVGDVGQVASWVDNAISNEGRTLLNASTYVYTADKITSFVNSTGGSAGAFFDKLFGTGRHHETNQTLIDNDEGHTLDANGGNDIEFGNGGSDVLQGYQGQDLLDGGADRDFIFGGSDNDVINGGDGDDVVEGQGADDTVFGGNGHDVIYGDWKDGLQRSQDDSGYNDGNDDLHGGAGVDELHGGWGNDTLYGDGGDDKLDGDQGGNVLHGGAGNDTLASSGGSATMDGGAGDDRYIVASYGDEVQEGTGQGNDTVEASIVNPKGLSLNNGYALPDQVENLIITQGARINAFGNDLDNVIVGSSAFNEIWAGAGNDTLDGGGVNDANDMGDKLHGGPGNDTYRVNDTRVQLDEGVNEGIDTVQASVNYSLPTNVEQLVLTGTGNLNGSGNALANVITGNAGANVLDGGAGADTLIGGEGSDTYLVDLAADQVIELAGQGIDEIVVGFSYLKLPAQVEKLLLTGTAAINGGGNELDNSLYGNVGINVLSGGAGNDFLYGNGGADTLIGGTGDDTYAVDNAGVVITEQAGEGIDTVVTRLTTTLGANLENLTLSARSKVDGTGNALNNVLTGNAVDNTLNGAGGDDVLIGADGRDTLTGGTGHDVFQFSSDDATRDQSGTDVITDFSVSDALRFEGATFTASSFVNAGTTLGPNQISVSSSGGVTLLHINLDGSNRVIDIQLAGSFSRSDFTASGTDVRLVNHAPTGTPSAALPAGQEEHAYRIEAATLLKGFADVDGDTLAVAGLSATQGALSDNGDGSWTFVPDALYRGPVVLGYTVADGNGGTIDATQAFNLAAFNHAPTGGPSAGLSAGTEDTAYPLNATQLLAGFSDADGDGLSVAALSANHGLVVVGTNGNFTLIPDKDYNGPETLSYKVVDGQGGSAAALLSLDLASVNDPAVLGSANVTVLETDAPIVATGTLAISDVDSPASFMAQPATAGHYGSFSIATNGAWTYTANSAYDQLNPGDSLTDRFPVVSADGTATQVSVAIAGTADTSRLHLGDAPARQTGVGGQWAAAWTQAGVAITQKADVTNDAQAWTAVTLSGVSPQTLAGGDIYTGALGVSGQSANTSAVRQEIDGKEALRLSLAGSASSVTLKLANLFTNDDGKGFSESGLLRLLDAQGHVVGEQAFIASAADGSKTVVLSSATSFNAIELLAGAYDNQGVFVFGGYSSAAGGFGSAISTDAQGLQHGSDFLLASVDLTVELMGVPA